MVLGKEMLDTSLLQMKVKSLEKYKSNYNMLCSQLGELNDQVGKQLQQHESDVSALRGQISILEESNRQLKTSLSKAQSELVAQKNVLQRDRENTANIQRQLDEATNVIKDREQNAKHKEKSKVRLIDELKATNKRLRDELDKVALEKEEVVQLKAELQSVLRQRENDAETISTLEKTVKRQKRRLKEQSTALKDLEAHSDACRTRCDEVLTKSQLLASENGQFRTHLENLDQKLQKNECLLTQKDVEIESLQQVVQTMTRENEEYALKSQKYEETRSKLIEKQRKLKEKNDRILNLENGIEKLEQMVENRSHTKVNEVRLPVESKLQSRVEMLEQKLFDANDKLQHLQLQLLNTESDSINSKQEVHILFSEIKCLKQSLSQMAAEHEAAETRSAAVSQARAKLQSDREALKQAINEQIVSTMDEKAPPLKAVGPILKKKKLKAKRH